MNWRRILKNEPAADKADGMGWVCKETQRNAMSQQTVRELAGGFEIFEWWTWRHWSRDLNKK